MIRTSFPDINSFNTFYQNIIDDPRCLEIDLHVYTLIEFKEKSILRTMTSMPDTHSRITAVQNMFLDSHSGEDQALLSSQISSKMAAYTASQYSSDCRYYIYPYNKQSFMNDFFSEFLPSFSGDLFNYLTNKLPILSMKGTAAVILKSYEVKDQSIVDDINNYCSLQNKINLLVENLQDIQRIISTQNKDIEHLTQYSNSLQDSLDEAINALDTEKKQGINGYYRTWH